ncbi:sensor histidine kinase [Streptomyces acidiscabies]|uniref:sensor histidine kinase n=1 Tax=Streptomyces acidiscabies TaxID=42234 RepID=UPI0038F669B4
MIRTRLLLFVGALLAVVCTAMASATVLAQRAHLLGELDDRVTAAAVPGAAGDPVGLLAARTDATGRVLTARVTGRGNLTLGQREALTGITPDGGKHTRTVPGLGDYRLTAPGGNVLVGLPLAGVQNAVRGLLLVETAIAAVGLTAAVGGCAMVIRRQLRPLERLVTTATRVSRAPLTELTRLPEPDADLSTEAGRLATALNRMIDRVEASRTATRHTEERMRRFLSDASHELRTPLASISGYAELMNRDAGVMPAELAWSRVSAESARMTGVVENLLLLARLDEGGLLERGEVDVAGVVTEAVWRARTRREGYEWELELGVGEGALVVGDEARLHQAVTQLLANAQTHTPPGTRVTVSVEAAGGVCVIRVRDTGPGIPPDLLPTVFDRFTRADTSRARAHGAPTGSGLGLAVAAAIVGAHDGTLRARSRPGETEFTVELPLVRGTAGAVKAAVRQRT